MDHETWTAINRALLAGVSRDYDGFNEYDPEEFERELLRYGYEIKKINATDNP